MYRDIHKPHAVSYTLTAARKMRLETFSATLYSTHGSGETLLICFAEAENDKDYLRHSELSRSTGNLKIESQLFRLETRHLIASTPRHAIDEKHRIYSQDSKLSPSIALPHRPTLTKAVLS
jgi:hypothetical protein